MAVTAAEIDEEIENVANRFGIGREAWLRTLDKERDQPRAVRSRHHLSRPCPAEALPRMVQVTPGLQEAFESQYGESCVAG